MNIQTLTKALTMYKGSLDSTSAEIKDCDNFISQLAELHDNNTDMCDIWNDDVYAIYGDTASSVCNYLFYDEIGPQLRKNPQLTTAELVKWIREYARTEHFSYTDEFLTDGIDHVRELWADNDKLGDNNADGTFNDSKDGYVQVKVEDMQTAINTIRELTEQIDSINATLDEMFADGSEVSKQ